MFTQKDASDLLPQFVETQLLTEIGGVFLCDRFQEIQVLSCFLFLMCVVGCHYIPTMSPSTVLGVQQQTLLLSDTFALLVI